MSRRTNKYTLLGLSLVISGVLFAVFAWIVVGYMPLVAFSLATVILGVTSFALGRPLEQFSAETGLLLLSGNLDNVAALAEELGLRSHAVYLPSSLASGPLRTLIPLHGNGVAPHVKQAIEQRLIVQYGRRSDDVGILVASPGSSVISLVGEVSGQQVGDIEDLLTKVVVGQMDIAATVRVRQEGDKLTIDVGQSILPSLDHPGVAIVGSPLASIVASLIAEVIDQPISITRETQQGRRHTVEITRLDSHEPE